MSKFPFIEAEVVNGRLVEKRVTIIDQSTLTSDCWLIQMQGLSACDTCECKNKPRKCGGGETLKKMKAEHHEKP